MNSFARPEWQEGELGEIFAQKGFRRFEYVRSPDSGICRMALLVKNEVGGWDTVFELISREGNEGVAKYSISVGLKYDREGWEEERMYGVDGKRRIGLSVYHEGVPTGESWRDLEEMLYPNEGVCPDKLDIELTIALFIDQLTRLEFVRPVLVPEGLFFYIEPEELYPDTWAFAPNISNAAKLYVSAQTAEEKRVAAAINRYVIEREVGWRAG